MQSSGREWSPKQHLLDLALQGSLPKYERFIRPTGLRFTKAHVTHPELKCTFNLDIISVKKNSNGPMYISLGVMTKGTIIEVNVSELGLVTPAGKVVWAGVNMPIQRMMVA